MKEDHAFISTVVQKVKKSRGGGAAHMSKDLYDLRLGIYVRTKEFVVSVVSSASPSSHESLSYIQSVDEALFLFDETYYNHLLSIFRKSLRLALVNDLVSQPSSRESIADLAQEKMEILLWFADQVEDIRQKTIPYMRWH